MNATRLHALVCLALLVLATRDSRAAGAFRVTSVSPSGSALSEAEDGTRDSLTVGSRLVGPNRVTVDESARLMLFEETGVVMVVVGPAILQVRPNERGYSVELDAGRLIFIAPPGIDAVALLAPSLSKQPGEDVMVPVRPGTLFMLRTADRVEVAFVTGDAGSPTLEAHVGKVRVAVPPNQLLSSGGATEPIVTPIPGDWLSQHGFDEAAIRRMGAALGVASGRASRRDVADDLFRNIILWDRYAASSHVVPKLRPSAFNPESRQLTEAATTTKTQTARSGVQRPTPVIAANEVPLLSPAAAGVQLQDIQAGVTAVRLNLQASQLLSQTASRGLGFGGPSQLATPGFTGGLPTVGPAGLGARP